MSDKLEPQGFENIPTPEMGAEKRGATSQEAKSPGENGGKGDHKVEKSEPSI